MTGFGIYMLVISILGVVLNFYYAGQGGAEHDSGTLIIAGIWGMLNVLGIIFWGTGLGV